MKMLRYLLALLLTISICITTTSAHYHTNIESIKPIVSIWAENEVRQAKELGLIPQMEENWPDDYCQPITRTQFRRMAMQFVAGQADCDYFCLTKLVSFYYGEKDEYGRMISPFKDGKPGDAEAYYLGVIQGQDDGRFDPDGLITRQEAAVMLSRVCKVCSLKPQVVKKSINYSDAIKIANWARAAVEQVTSYGIMRGVTETSFAPESQYSIEQCILTFLRMYQNLHRNCNEPLFSYEQCNEMLTSWDKMGREENVGSYEVQRVEGDKATYVRFDNCGIMYAASSFYFLYRQGGMKRIDFGVCSLPVNEGILITSIPTNDCQFAENDTLFCCTIPLKNDVTVGNDIVHEHGIYHISINIDTLEYEIIYCEE